MNARMRLAILAAILMLPVICRSQASMTQILNNGPAENCINVVFLSEGYTTSELPRYLTTDVYTMMNSLFNTMPFMEYKTYFNVYAISVASNQSGSDHPSSGIYRDTYFSSSFDIAGIDRLLALTGDGYWRADSLLQEFMPSYDLVVVIVNDPTYGGSGGGIACTSVHPAAPEVVVHEVGHTFAQLGDEYDTYTPGYSGYETPNTTAETVRELIKWRRWINDETPVPTPLLAPYFNVIGLFEGACYQTTGWYRPKSNCKMRSLGLPFCEVCSEQLLFGNYERLTSIDAYLPVSPGVSLTNTQRASFQITPLVPVSHTLTIGWYVDGLNSSVNSPATFQPDGRSFGNGTHRLTARVTDASSLALADPDGVLTDTVSWTVNVSGVSFPAPVLSEPVDGATAQPLAPALSWHPGSGAQAYRLQVASTQDFSVTVYYQEGITDTSAIVLLPNPGVYYWRVASEDAQGPSAFSTARTFVTTASVPSLVRPLNRSVNQVLPLNLKWRRVTGAIGYHLQIGADSLFSSIVLDSTDIPDTLCGVGSLSYSTTYYWRVQATVTGDVSPYSAFWSFTTIYPPPAAPELLQPIADADSLPTELTFVWHASPTATTYRIRVAAADYSTIVSERSGFKDTSILLNMFGYKKTYHWWVSAANAAGEGSPSPWRTFRTIVQYPIPARPLNGAISQPLALNLVWRPIINPVSYRVQLALDSSFTDIVLDDSSLTTSYRGIADLLRGVTYYWRVRSISTDGDTLWSKAIFHFTTEATVTAQYSYAARWNLISVPLISADRTRAGLFPGALGPAYSYNNGYHAVDTLSNGIGYWLKYTSATTVTQTGVERLLDTVAVEEGWNMIGVPSVPVDTASIVYLDAVAQSAFFEYSNGYRAVIGLVPGKGYWIKMAGPGRIVLTH